ncbi:MAG: argininosuccinate lyase [Planctomycetes bacterium]|nr:argininosuccinate lyase [Planctomycetota bacterium]
MARRLWDKGEALHPEILEYTVGNDYVLDLDLVEEDVWGSLAHSQMLAEVGVIGDQDRAAIHAGLCEVLAEHRRGDFAISPEEEDVHTAVEGRLTAKVGPAGGKLHTGRSRNDQVLVDVRLFVKRRLLEAITAGAELARALLAVARTYADAPLPGYTHMRQAMPSSVGLWAAGHAEGIEEDLLALEQAYQAADRCPLGSAAGFGVPLPLDRRRTAALLGFGALQVNPQAVQTSRGKIEAQALFAATLLAHDLASLAWDLQLMSSPEYGFVRLPGRVATGSSIMPQKRNPDVCELTRANAGVLQSYLDRVLLVAGRLPSSYHRDYQLTKEPVLRGLHLVRHMTRAMELTVTDLQVDTDRAASAVAEEAYAAHRAFALAGAGVPFRDAYRQVGEALAKGERLRPTPEEERALPKVEGGLGDLRLDEAQARVDTLAARADERSTRLTACFEALESGARREGTA